MLAIKIVGSGFYLPSRIIENRELEDAYGLNPGWIERVTGVRERRRATSETSSQMAAFAAQKALAAAGLTADDLDLIVGASAAPQQAIPCTAALVQRELGAPDGRSTCFDLNATCLSFLFALQTVGHLVAAGTYQRALIFSSEIAGPSLNPAEPTSAVLFGDAAAAVIITRSPEGEASTLVGEQFVTYSSGARLTELVGGGTLHHPNAATTTPEMNLFHMDGPAVFRMAMQYVPPFLDRFFTTVGWPRSECDWVIPHQASRHGIELLGERLGFRPSQVINNLAVRGNCIGASIPLGLAEAIDDGRIQRGQRIALLGTGAGLAIGGVGLVY